MPWRPVCDGLKELGRCVYGSAQSFKSEHLEVERTVHSNREASNVSQGGATPGAGARS
jgi:hypothetical protein